MRHPMFFCSLSYCFLFCTILCPGSLLHIHLMTNYGVREGMLAMFQAVCSGFGVLGTFMVTRVTGKGVIGKGMTVGSAAQLFLLFQVVSLWLACLGLWLRNWSINFLVLLALSRIGLWGFDVSHLQLMQDGLGKSKNPATLSAIQYGLCDIFSVFITLAALLSSLVDFQALMFLSLCCVTVSLGVYQLWWWWVHPKQMKTE
jgi:hypothetical protein